MNMGGKPKRIFSEFTFDLIERCYVEYGGFVDVICESDDYDNFLKYVEEPFTQLCQEISKILPVCLAFIELRSNYEVLQNYHRKRGFAVEGLINILQQLNQAIADKNYEIGISFFLTDNLRDDIEDIWRMEIEPYLEEYFFNQLEKVDKFRWDKIKDRVQLWI